MKRYSSVFTLTLSFVLLVQCVALGRTRQETTRGTVRGTVNKGIDDLRATSAKDGDLSGALGRFAKVTSALGNDAVPALIDALAFNGDGAWLVRFGVVSALTKIGPSAIPALVARLRDPNPQVSYGVADALAQIGGPEVFDAVERSQTNSTVLAKRRAIYALGTIDEASIADGGTGTGSDDSDRIGKRIAYLVSQLKDEATHSEAELSLIRIAQNATPKLLDRVIAKLVEVVRAARFSHPITMMAGFSAARVLGSIGQPAIAPVEQILAEDYAPDADSGFTAADECGCGCCAMEALAFMGVTGVSALMSHATNLSSSLPLRNLRGMAMQALSDIGPIATPAVVEFIKNRQSTSNPKYAEKVGLTVLGSIADPNAEAFLAGIADQEQDPSLRKLAQWALEKTRTRNGGVVASQSVAIDDTLASASFNSLADALRVAEETGDDTALHLTNIVSRSRFSGVSAVPDLVRVLSDHSARHWVVRMAAIAGLISIGDRATPALGDVLGSNDSQAAFGAADALAQIGTAQAVDVAAEHLRSTSFNFLEKQRSIYVLGRIGSSRAITVLTGALSNEVVQYEAAQALRQIGAPAIPALQSVVRNSKNSDEKSLVAAYTAARVLGQLGEKGHNALASIIQERGTADNSSLCAATHGLTFTGHTKLVAFQELVKTVFPGRLVAGGY